MLKTKNSLLKPLSHDFFKLNVDGAILRDEKCDVIMTASKVENEVANHETIELLSMFGTFQFCIH